VPYLIIVGAREAEKNIVAVRTRAGDDLGAMDLDSFTQRLQADIACRGRDILED
jgi:threonyl-tRNA synthetase